MMNKPWYILIDEFCVAVLLALGEQYIVEHTIAEIKAEVGECGILWLLRGEQRLSKDCIAKLIFG